MTPQVNGLVAFFGKGDLHRLLQHALKSIAHRAWAGFWVLPPCPSIAIGGCLSNFLPTQDDTLLHGVIYSPRDFDLCLETVRRTRKGDLCSFALDLAKIDGAYALVHASDDGLILVRDPLGIKPLYIARTKHIVGVASEMKALISVGLENIRRVEPGWIHHIRLHSEEKYKIRTWHKIDPLQVDLDEASEKVLNLLTESVRIRIAGQKRICIGFSGGLDCSFIALLASRMTNVDLVTICTKNSRDRVEAEASARLLGLDLTPQIVDETIVTESLKYLCYLIETKKIMDISIGLAFYLAAKKAFEMGHNHFLLGQMADELFGGYARYLMQYERNGISALQENILQDVLNAHRTNFERDDKATSPFTQIDLPYASINLVDYALLLPPQLKIDLLFKLRKTILRRAAIKAGLPEEIAFRAKKAVQYSSGIQNMVEHLRDSKSIGYHI